MDVAAFYATFDERVRAIVAHAYAHAPATRRRFEEAGVTPDDIRSAADLARLPVLR
ncbi:MAG: phenylacetate--CoA ligase family protein, partial [Chloroflexi bacterium]